MQTCHHILKIKHLYTINTHTHTYIKRERERRSVSDHFCAPLLVTSFPKTLAHIRTGGGATKLWLVTKAEPQATPWHLKTPLMCTAFLVLHASFYARDSLRAGRLYVSVYTRNLTNLYNNLYEVYTLPVKRFFLLCFITVSPV